jgi:endo-1,4-beta-xylanase
MQNKTFYSLIAGAFSLLLSACGGAQKSPSDPATSSLRETFKNDFLIGTALNIAQIEEKDPKAAELIPRQFSAITPENIMKAEVIHPQWDKYNFELGDKLVAYAQKNNIKVNAHTLIWHSQLPAFVRNIKTRIL